MDAESEAYRELDRLVHCRHGFYRSLGDPRLLDRGRNVYRFHGNGGIRILELEDGTLETCEPP